MSNQIISNPIKHVVDGIVNCAHVSHCPHMPLNEMTSTLGLNLRDFVQSVRRQYGSLCMSNVVHTQGA